MRKTEWLLTALAISFSCTVLFVPARGEDNDRAALARALQGPTTTLEAGLKASEREGKPISAKFEIEGGRLQLSVYTTKNGQFAEVVLDPGTGTIAKTEKITEGDDLKEATEQGAAMAKATQSLLAATGAAVGANGGFRAVSIFPELKDGHPVGEITLLQGNTFKQVAVRLD